jgi:hypothetical protein
MKPLLILLVISFSITAFAMSISPRLFPSVKETKPVATSQGESSGARPAAAVRDEHVRSGAVWPQLRGALATLGDRLERPGKERVTLSGTIHRGGGSDANAFILVRESSGRVRFQEQDGHRARTVAFDGREAWKPVGRPDQSEEALLETLVYDSADQFLVAHARGTSTRFLGSRFRLDEGDSEGYGGPFYDLYQISDLDMTGQEPRRQTRTYYVNSDTLLLERVRYETERAGAVIRVEVLCGDWRDVQGQKFPFSVTRLENGVPVMSINVSAVGVGPKADDGTFTNPQGGQQGTGR